eukprot:scaffold22604_cov67-Isochrysis_galbana.AAC.2
MDGGGIAPPTAGIADPPTGTTAAAPFGGVGDTGGGVDDTGEGVGDTGGGLAQQRGARGHPFDCVGDASGTAHLWGFLFYGGRAIVEGVRTAHLRGGVG